MRRTKKQCKTMQSAAPQETEQERELRPPPSPTACGCWSDCFTLFNRRDRIQERQREEEQLQQVQGERREMDLKKTRKQQKNGKKQRKQEEQRNLQSARESHDEEVTGMEQIKRENDIRSLEENVKQQEMEILRFREREEKLKEKLEKMKEKIARKERKTLKIVQRDEKLKRELQAMRERLAQKDRQREEERNGTNLKTVQMTITVSVRKETNMDGETEKQKEKEQQKESVRDESDTVPQEAGPQPQAFTESKSEDQASEAQTQVQADGSESGQAAEEKMERTGHDSGEAVSIEMENLQVEPAARSSSGSWMLQSVLSPVRSIMQRLRSHFSAGQVQAEEEEECEEVSQPRRLIPLGAPTGVLTVHLKTCRDFSKAALLKKGTWATVRVTIGRMVKYTEQQPYKDPMCFNEWKHFTVQIQQEEDVLGVQQSSLMVVELLICDPDSGAPRLVGRDTIKLQEILKKSSGSHQFNLRLRHQKICKLDADLAFTYGSLGYGYSHQIKHPGRTMENLVEKSLFPRCPPNEDQRDPHYNVTTPSTLPRVGSIPSLVQQDTTRGTECRISAGLMGCIQRRGRLLQLHKSLQECKTGEDRVQFLENLILRKSLGTSYPCRKSRSSEVLSKEEEMKRNEEDENDGTTETRTRTGKATCKTRK